MAKRTGRPKQALGGTAEAPRVTSVAKPRRSFTAAIVVPALLLYAVSAAVVVFCLSMMAQHMNRLEDQRGLRS